MQSSLEFLNILKLENPTNFIFKVPMKRLRNLLGIQYTSSNDKSDMVECIIDESRYKISENYKISLKPLDSNYSIEHFYISDLNSLINSDIITYSINK